MPDTMMRFLWGLVPRRLRKGVKYWICRLGLSVLLSVFAWFPRQAASSHRFLKAIHFCWGNREWSASPAFLQACLARVMETRGAIVECGSGLSSLLVGILARRTACAHRILEHDAAWSAALRPWLTRFCAHSRIEILPLVDYGDFFWYEKPQAQPQGGYKTVICDGPPGTTPGGRFGLLAVLQSQLAEDAVILLDDAGRPGEQCVLQMWRSRFGLHYELVDGTKPFALVRKNA